MGTASGKVKFLSVKKCHVVKSCLGQNASTGPAVEKESILIFANECASVLMKPIIPLRHLCAVL